MITTRYHYCYLVNLSNQPPKSLNNLIFIKNTSKSLFNCTPNKLNNINLLKLNFIEIE